MEESVRYSNKKNIVKSKPNSTNVLTSDMTISPNTEVQYDLRWPTSQERDFTQIIAEDTSHTKSKTRSNINTSRNTGKGRQEKELQQCPERKKFQNKKSCDSEENKICLNDSSDSFHGHKPKTKLGKLSPPVESEKLADSNDLQTISYWVAFSDEIILGIFSFFNKRDLCLCAKVCRRWRRLAYDDSLWQSLDLTGLKMGDDVLEKLFMRGVVVMRLTRLQVQSTDKLETVDENNTESGAEESYTIQYLDASSCSIDESVLIQSLSKCRNLKKLSLESCSVSNGVLRAISRCEQLSVLNLCMCREINKRGLRSIAFGCDRITELNLGWTHMTPESISTVVKSFPLLIKLNLSGCRETLRDEEITDLLTTCKNLTFLDVSDCIMITERSVKSVIEHGEMKQLSLSRCYGITPKSLELFSSLKSLRSINVYGLVTDPGLSVLKKALKRININKNMFSTIARPTGSVYKHTIWGMKCLGPC